MAVFSKRLTALDRQSVDVHDAQVIIEVAAVPHFVAEIEIVIECLAISLVGDLSRRRQHGRRGGILPLVGQKGAFGCEVRGEGLREAGGGVRGYVRGRRVRRFGKRHLIRHDVRSLRGRHAVVRYVRFVRFVWGVFVAVNRKWTHLPLTGRQRLGRLQGHDGRGDRGVGRGFDRAAVRATVHARVYVEAACATLSKSV